MLIPVLLWRSLTLAQTDEEDAEIEAMIAPRCASLIVVAAVAVSLAAPFWARSFTITLLNYIGIYALVALGLVLLTGVGGLTSFGQAAFVGIGAYATAWLTTACTAARPGSGCCSRWC